MPPAATVPLARHYRWRHMLRSALLVLTISIAIGVLMWTVRSGGLVPQIVSSLCIGACCWLIIDGGRMALAYLIDRRHAAHGLPPLPHGGFPGWPGMILVVLVGMAAGPVAGTALSSLLLDRPVLSMRLDSASFQVTLALTVIASFVAVGLITALERGANARAAAEAAQRAAAEHQLRLLQSQLEPHMLFNTLANLRVLIGLDPARAQAMLDQLISFLRATLGASRVDRHALSAEFARLADYLALMQVRMGARLQVGFELPPALAECSLPPLLLQPLVENAIRHGLERKVAGGRIDVRARRDGSTLVLEVRDTGIGLAAAQAQGSDGSSFGLAQVRERLATLYGAQASLVLGDATDADGGVLATVRLPLGATALPAPPAASS